MDNKYCLKLFVIIIVICMFYESSLFAYSSKKQHNNKNKYNNHISLNNTSNLKNIESLLKQYQISDVITFTPKKSLKIIYSNKYIMDDDKDITTLTPTITKQQPKVIYQANDNEWYTLIKVDPDAPSHSNPTAREWLHWLVVNIPGNKISNAQILYEYIGAAPGNNSGYHRYIFILCKQKSKTHFKGEYMVKSDTTDKRDHFKVKDFINKWQLEPIGINFYQAQYDDYVPSIYNKFKNSKDKPIQIK